MRIEKLVHQISIWYKIDDHEVQILKSNMAADLKLRMWSLGNRAPEDTGETRPARHDYLVFESLNKNPLGKSS